MEWNVGHNIGFAVERMSVRYNALIVHRTFTSDLISILHVQLNRSQYLITVTVTDRVIISITYI